MTDELKVGLIGLDTSHVERFAEVLNDESNPHYMPGARIVAGFPGGSEDFDLSIDRVEGFTGMLRDRYGVHIHETPEAVAEASDVVVMTSVDGRVHAGLFDRIAPMQKPTFIDKPFAVSVEDAEAIVQKAGDCGTPVFGASSLRFIDDLVNALNDDEHGTVTGADFYGPMEIQPTQPGLFWYGIHTVEMLYATLGKGCRKVSAVSTEKHDLVAGEWSDGRIGIIRGTRTGNFTFGGTVHREKKSRVIDTGEGNGRRPKYVCILDQMLKFFRTGKSPVDNEETVETIRFIEAANRSRGSGETVELG